VGDQKAVDALVPLVYDELRSIAHARLRGERSGHTLSTTALVHESYLKLVDINQVKWQDRAHFFSVASRMMRRVLVDYESWPSSRRSRSRRSKILMKRSRSSKR
jgi:RNA polymerase sigma factor (TIGR02999 family)